MSQPHVVPAHLLPRHVGAVPPPSVYWLHGVTEDSHAYDVFVNGQPLEWPYEAHVSEGWAVHRLLKVDGTPDNGPLGAPQYTVTYGAVELRSSD